VQPADLDIIAHYGHVDEKSRLAMAQEFEDRWNDPVRRERLMALVHAVEHVPELIGLSLHLLAAGRKGTE
jgi:hypothetical protein